MLLHYVDSAAAFIYFSALRHPAKSTKAAMTMQCSSIRATEADEAIATKDEFAFNDMSLRIDSILKAFPRSEFKAFP